MGLTAISTAEALRTTLGIPVRRSLVDPEHGSTFERLLLVNHILWWYEKASESNGIHKQRNVIYFFQVLPQKGIVHEHKGEKHKQTHTLVISFGAFYTSKKR